MRLVGGELQTYLPQRDHVILAGCFTVKNMNPDAPLIIQVGKPDKVVKKAELLSKQPENRFPVFLKQNGKEQHYFYAGHFKFKDLKYDATTITTEEKKSGRFGQVAAILYLQPA